MLCLADVERRYGRLTSRQLITIVTCSSVVGFFFLLALALRIRFVSNADLEATFVTFRCFFVLLKELRKASAASGSLEAVCATALPLNEHGSALEQHQRVATPQLPQGSSSLGREALRTASFFSKSFPGKRVSNLDFASDKLCSRFQCHYCAIPRPSLWNSFVKTTLYSISCFVTASGGQRLDVAVRGHLQRLARSGTSASR